MATGDFSYQPINSSSLRILELFPGEAAEPLRGKLHVCSEHPWKLAYECISYQWGCSDFTHSIVVDGGKLPITASLHAVLRALRCVQRNRRLSSGKEQDLMSIPTSGSRFLWADGICIKQHDDKEKAGQVIRMAAYYKATLRVLIHLGPEFQGSGHLLLDLLKRTSRYIRRKKRETEEEKRAISRNPRHQLPPISPIPRELLARDDRIWDPLRAVFDSSYWSRYWIIQEVVEARTALLYYGQGFIQLDEFCAFNRLVQFREGVGKVGRSWSLIDLIEHCRLSNASNPCDYIYGLLGSAPEVYGLRDDGSSFEMTSASIDLLHELLDIGLDDEAPVLRVDYEESITSCFHRFARYMVCWGDGIKLLYAASWGHRPDGPSWVPDWLFDAIVNFAPFHRHAACAWGQ
ncbi:heterokaryon incompatibility protein-domain-containing protein [Ilyonectria destructans]|nr:heterokaryon incompatibility protein-domain-containing protein [Ilyonectria destructans]